MAILKTGVSNYEIDIHEITVLISCSKESVRNLLPRLEQLVEEYAESVDDHVEFIGVICASEILGDEDDYS